MPRERDKFKPRQWSAEDIEAMRLHLQETNREAMREDVRRAMVGNLPTLRKACLHIQRVLVEVETDYGVWGMEICTDCGDQVAKECAHGRSDWQLDDQLLVCGNCGYDGT